MNEKVLYPQVMRDPNQVPNRPDKCAKCGCRTFTEVKGWPGEYLFSCTECHGVNGGYFCPWEVE